MKINVRKECINENLYPRFGICLLVSSVVRASQCITFYLFRKYMCISNFTQSELSSLTCQIDHLFERND